MFHQNPVPRSKCITVTDHAEFKQNFWFHKILLYIVMIRKFAGQIGIKHMQSIIKDFKTFLIC